MEKKDLSVFDVLGKHYDLPYAEGTNRTKEQILIESTLLFALKGYSDVSMRDIAQKVGITPAALYNHFTTKRRRITISRTTTKSRCHEKRN